MRRAPRWLLAITLLLPVVHAGAQRQIEALGRGLVAVNQGDGRVFLSWRLLATDPDAVAFNIYRVGADGAEVLLNKAPVNGVTWWQDQGVDLTHGASWRVRAVVDGTEQGPAGSFALPPGAPVLPYLAIPLQTPEGYTPNDAAVGDLDGDGEYEIVLKQEMRPHDNSQSGVDPGTTKLEAYRLDGTLMWRVDLGINIREGAHYTPFIVYDLDGDGCAELAVRTSEGTVDGTGAVIGDVNGDGRTDYRNPKTGYVLEGPEFISIFDGRTGRERARADYIARGKVTDWGDNYGNRVDRFLMAVAYVDGTRPSLILCRGYYALTKLEAWNYRDGALNRLWAFSSGDAGNEGYAGQGNHNLCVADVDGDGRDEIVFGACCIDDNGRGLYTTRLGHGDAMHLSDLDPDRPGLEVYSAHERPSATAGAEFRDAATGALIWGVPSRGDVGRAVALDIDPRFRGCEVWSAGGGTSGLYTCKGQRFSDARLPCNMGVWWDGDLLRELLDGTTISKWDPVANAAVPVLTAADYGCASNNGTKANPCLCADILGDWREEVLWRSADNRELRLFTTTIPTTHRLVTLMHDPVYRISAALQNIGYNQPSHPGFYLGEGMNPPARPSLYTPRAEPAP